MAEIYLLAPIQNAVVERSFTFQNIIITPKRNRILIRTVGKKLLIKYSSWILSSEEIEKILELAAISWCTKKNRRAGQGCGLK